MLSAPTGFPCRDRVNRLWTGLQGEPQRLKRGLMHTTILDSLRTSLSRLPEDKGNYGDIFNFRLSSKHRCKISGTRLASYALIQASRATE